MSFVTKAFSKLSTLELYMSDIMPNRLLKLKVLADVPRAEFCDAPRCENPRDQESRLSFIQKLRKGNKDAPVKTSVRRPIERKTFNAAAWLRFKETPSQPISLWLVYRDERDEFAVMLDEAKLIAGASTMLSGRVTIDTKGTVEYLRACCGGARTGEIYSVEELYVQREVPAAASNGGEVRSA